MLLRPRGSQLCRALHARPRLLLKRSGPAAQVRNKRAAVIIAEVTMRLCWSLLDISIQLYTSSQLPILDLALAARACIPKQ